MSMVESDENRETGTSVYGGVSVAVAELLVEESRRHWSSYKDDARERKDCADLA